MSEGQWIIDQKYWEGPEPPNNVGEDREWVEMVHEMYIPVSKARIVSVFEREATTEAQKEKFKHFVQLLDGIYHFHFHETLNELKEDYEFFSPETGEKEAEKGDDNNPADGPSEQEIQMRERRFMANFMKLMERGNFAPLTQHEYNLADASSFVFDMPVEANWETHDDSLIRDFTAWSATSEGTRHLKDCIPGDEESLNDWLDQPEQTKDQMLIFTRGKRPEHVEGAFILSKLNLLIERVVKLVIRVAASMSPKLQARLGAVDNEYVRPPSPDIQVAFEKRWLRRLNLENQLLNWSTFVGKTELQEPAFERVVCLFRMQPKDPFRALRTKPIIGGIVNKVFKAPDEPAVKPISIKIFKNIPMADLEVVYPDKKLKMRPFDKTVLSLVIIATLVGSIIKLKAGDPTDGASGFLTFIGIIAAVALKTVMGFLRTRVKYIAKIAQDLYERNLDSNLGVVQFLVDSVEEQEFKEAFLCYLLLVQNGAVMDANGNVAKGMTNEDLDEAVEKFLEGNFDIEVDFDVDGALELVAARGGPDRKPIPTPSQDATRKFLPIVGYAGEGDEREFWAIPLDDALRAMDEKWDNFFQYNVDDEA
jgi:hypothetical protein